MRRLALVAGVLAGAASAQPIDVTGLWACSVAEYGSGEPADPDLFNMSIGRSGEWALSGRGPDGAVYQGRGTWRFGRGAADTVTVVFTGSTLVPGGIAEPFAMEADLVGPDEISRITRRYGTTRAIDCLRQHS